MRPVPPEGYCRYCNRIVDAYGHGSVLRLKEHMAGRDGDYGSVGAQYCEGGKKIAPDEIPVENPAFAFVVREERACRLVGAYSVHKAHHYRYRTYYWCPGYERQ